MRYIIPLLPALVIMLAACTPVAQSSGNASVANTAHTAELAANRQARKQQYRGPRGSQL